MGGARGTPACVWPPMCVPRLSQQAPHARLIPSMAKSDPHHELQVLVDRTRRAGQDLFTFTTTEAEFINRDKGIYAYLLAKPARRLASALSLDRELLILLSFYADQQQRTIKTARDLILQYEGRLESNVVIIV